MFNKYRGQPQIKNINRSSEKDAFIRKPQAKPAVEDVTDDSSIRSAIDSVAEPVKKLDADYEASRQQEEDEWFRRFKGEPEPKEEPVSDEEAELPEETAQDPKRIEITDEPVRDHLKEGSSDASEESDDTTTEYPEIEESEAAEETESEELAESAEEMAEEDVAPQEEEPIEEPQSESAPVTEDKLENQETMEIPDDLEPAEEEQNVTAEEDDEKWIQDLLSDIQEKTGSAVDEGSVEDENSQPLVIAVPESKEPLETVDESDWYQSTPLIRTAALIVLDLTEPVDEEYVEETPEDEESYQSYTEATEEAEFVLDPDELLDPIDEEFVDESEEDLEEITIDDVDEKLATLMEDEPKTDLDMDEMLDNMDRIIQQTEPTPVKFMEEPAPAPQPRVNPNRNRKKKKKKKR